MNIKFETVKLAGRRPATFFVRPAYHRLGEVDREKLHYVITNAEGGQGRSFSFRIIEPFEHRGKRYLAFRCKGINPIVDEKGKALLYLGKGFDPAPILVDSKGGAFVAPPDPTPQGSNTYQRVLNEFEIACRLGVGLTDFPLGQGFYEDISFNGDRVGFVVYAMQSFGDFRLLRDLINLTLRSGGALKMPPHDSLFGNGHQLNSCFANFGRVLLEMHRKGLSHRYPHLNNVGLLEGADSEIVIRDLDTAKKLDGMSPEQRIGYLMLDLAEVMFSLLITRECRFKGVERFFSLSNLIFPFMLGYLGVKRVLQLDLEELIMLKEPYIEIIGRWIDREQSRFDFPSWAQQHPLKSIRSLYRRLAKLK